MAPQPAAAPAAPAAYVNPHKALLDRIATKVEKKETLTSGEKQIARALRLERERAEGMKKIAANREYLRLMEENEELDDDEASFLDDWYPNKERGATRSDDEIETTRKLKAAVHA